MDFYIIVDQLFNSDIGVDRFHDAIFEACGASHDDETLKKLFYELPVRITNIAIERGMDDTKFGDAVYQYVKQEGNKYGTL